MPYPTIESLPPTFNNLPNEAKRQAMHVVNSALKRGLSEERAIKSAWGAVKKSWKKVGDKWVKKMTDDFQLETRDMKNVEIFAVGKWNDKKYTESDLYDIANNFNILKDEVKPYLKLGHDPDQKLLQSDGYPSAGWVTNLKVISGKLVADIVGIPKKIFELIESGGYKRVSCELYVNFRDHMDNVYNKVLRAVALLGADTPAIGTLGDLIAQHDEENREYDNYVFNTNEGGEILSEEDDDKKNKEENKMTTEEIIKKFQDEAAESKKAKEEAEAKAKKAEEEKVEADKKAKAAEDKAAADKKTAEEANAAKNKLEQEKDEMKKKEKEKDIDTFIQTLLKEQKIVPKQSPFVKAVLLSLDETKVLTYKDGETEKKMPIVEVFKKLMASNTEGKLLGELSAGDTLTFTKLEDAIDDLMKKNDKLTYGQATKEASRLFPTLVEVPTERKE